jgi:hypothetical protein
MFDHAEDHQVRKTYSKCETRHKYSLVLQNNYTICSHCNDPLYQLASVRDSGDEDKCGKHAIVGEVDLNDCCVRIHIEKRDIGFDLIFGFFIVIFLIVFAGLYVTMMRTEYMDYMKAPLEVPDDDRMPPTQPAPAPVMMAWPPSVQPSMYNSRAR